MDAAEAKFADVERKIFREIKLAPYPIRKNKLEGRANNHAILKASSAIQLLALITEVY